jgi:hypothetical protein
MPENKNELRRSIKLFVLKFIWALSEKPHSDLK